MADRRHPHVINLDELEFRAFEPGTKMGNQSKQLGDPTGARGIGASYYEVAPGKVAFPCHFHCANEESVFILEGEGAARIGKDTVAVRAGDYITYPIGPDAAHQLRNTGTTPLRYLCFSTRSTAEVVGYPDSKKIGASGAASMEAALRGERWVRIMTREGTQVDYFDGEDIG